jgi:hypothetical protein
LKSSPSVFKVSSVLPDDCKAANAFSALDKVLQLVVKRRLAMALSSYYEFGQKTTQARWTARGEDLP